MPKQKRLGRLLDKHAETVDSLRGAVLESPIAEWLRIQSIDHVVDQTADNRRWRDLRQRTDQPGRGAVDDDVERLVKRLRVGDAQARVFESINQRPSACCGPIRHDQTLRVRAKQRAEDPAYRTPSPKYEDAFVCQSAAQIDR